MSSRVRNILLILADLALAVYLVFAFSAFNKPEEKGTLCTQVNVIVADATTNGFISGNDVVARLKKAGIYPQDKPLKSINCRTIEEELAKTPFVRSAECYKNQAGEVNISITQMLPILRVKAENNDDYYIDDKDGIMQVSNTEYTSDLIVATGAINRTFAMQYLSPLARTIVSNDLYRNMFEQINITATQGVELVPRIGDHIIYLGHLPVEKNKTERDAAIEQFTKKKLERLILFYKHGLPYAGWNKYNHISLEFENQIICKKDIIYTE